MIVTYIKEITMKQFFKKTVLLALIAAMGVAAMPFVRVSAAGAYDLAPPQGPISNEKLERIWARQLRAYERMARTDEFMAKVQQLIDRAEANDRDASAVQAALDAFELQINEAHPIYESMKGIINSHPGFDGNGNVTDPEKARETVREMGEKLKEIRETLNGTGKALRDAIRAFRDTSLRQEKTPGPADS